MRHGLIAAGIAGVFTASIVDPSFGAFVPVSATRSLQIPAPVTQTGFGGFNFSRMASAGNSQAPFSVTIAQNSNIGTDLSTPMVSYFGSMLFAGGGTSAQTIPVQNSFSLIFSLTSERTIQHTFPTLAPQYFTASITPSAGPAVNLFSGGSNGQILPAGQYTLSIVGTGTAFSGNNSSSTLSGEISFVPAPLPGGVLLIGSLLGLRRRRK